jgi:hypothetical protein
MGGGFVPDYSSVGDIYRYQGGGSTSSQDEQIAQYIQAYAQLSKRDPQEIYQALQSLPPAQQQEALQNIVQTVQQVMSQQQGGGDEEQQMAQDDSGYYSAPGGEPQYAMQQPSEEEEAQQMRNGGSYSGTYYQGTYFANGGLYKGDMGFNVTSETTKPKSPLLPNNPVGYADSTLNANKNIPYFADLMKGKAPIDKDGMTEEWSIRGMDHEYKSPYMGTESYVRPRYKNVNGKYVPMTEDEIYNSSNFITFPSQYTASVFNEEMARRANSKPNKKAYGGAFVPTYGDSSYNDQFGGQIYDYDNYILPKAQGGLQAPNKVSKKDFEAKVASGEYKPVLGTKTARKGNTTIVVEGTYKPGTPGSTTGGTKGSYVAGRNVAGGRRAKSTDPCANMKFTVEDMKANPGCYGTFLEKEGWKNATPQEQQEALDRLRGGNRSTYVPGTPGTTVAETKGMCLDANGKPDPTLEYDEKTGNCQRKKETEDFITYEEGEEGPKAGDTSGGNFGGGYYGIPFQNTLGIMAAAAYPPLYLRPFYDEPQGVIPRPTFYDPERELASAQETARGLEQMATIMNPQTAGALANYVQANAAKSSADTIGRYQNLNVGVANQFSPLQAQIFNSLAAQKREAKDKRFMGETIAAQQYQNAMRTYGRDFAKVLGEGMDAGIKMGQLYDTNPYYTADPFGRLRLKPGVDAADAIMNGSMAGRGSIMSADEYLKRAKKYKDAGHNDQMIRDAMRMQYGSGSSGRSSSTDDDAAFNYGSSAYPFMS